VTAAARGKIFVVGGSGGVSLLGVVPRRREKKLLESVFDIFENVWISKNISKLV
jgi:hypothetical protein